MGRHPREKKTGKTQVRTRPRFCFFYHSFQGFFQNPQFGARHGWRWQWKSPKWRLSPPTCTECLVCMHCMQHETPGADLQCSICCSGDRRHFRSSHVASPCHAPGGQVAIGIMCAVLKKGVHRHQGACARAFVRSCVRACVLENCLGRRLRRRLRRRLSRIRHPNDWPACPVVIHWYFFPYSASPRHVTRKCDSGLSESRIVSPSQALF